MGFNIFFHGLVCHRTEENTAVFINAAEHELRLAVLKDDVVNSNGFDADPPDDALHLDPRIDPELQISFRIGNRVLKVGGAVPVQSTFTSYFRRFVPSLRAQSSCQAVNVRQEIVNHEIGEQVSGYLLHPGGAFSVHDFFPEKQTLTGFVKDADCMARTIQLALTTNGNNVTIGNDAASITLKPDAEVRIVNVLPPFVAGPSNMHFHHYYHALYEGCNSGKVPMPVGGLKCTHRHDPSFAVPGGDCGNTGDP
jgi:hypothetical protein